MKKIGVIMGSDSDLPVVEKAVNTLKEYGVPFEVHVFSAHRTPNEAADFAINARANGFGAIIAAAGSAIFASMPKPVFIICFNTKKAKNDTEKKKE